MNIYHVSRTDEYGYDDFSDFVVVCETEQQAKETYPGEGYVFRDDHWVEVGLDGNVRPFDKDNEWWCGWTHPSKTTVELVGISTKEESRVICSSFHAG